MSTYKLVLNVGDRVRNINKRSSRYNREGRVYSSDAKRYYVIYDNTVSQVYYKDMAHMYLEKIEEPIPACGCIHDELCDVHTRQAIKALTFIQRYGASTVPGRQTLKKVRRNVITGKTQDEMVKEYGPAAGTAYFNTRATGRSTGEAYRIVGTAMCNPGKVFSYRNSDHVFAEGTQTPHRANDVFYRTMCDVIGDKRGFTFNRHECTIMFNPIVTEETYVTRSY